MPDADFVFQRKEGGVNEGWNSQHDGGTEGRTRRRVALMKGGTMTALGNNARGSTAGGRRQGAAQQQAARRRQRQQGAAWQDDKGKGRHGSEGQYSCHKGLTHAEIKHYTNVGIHNDYTLAITVIGTIRYYRSEYNRKQ